MTNRVLLGAGALMLAGALVLGGLGLATGNLGRSAGTTTWMPGGMMGGWWGGAPGGATISMDTAQSRVQAYLDRTGDSDLKIDELIEFDLNFYALVKEKSTGKGAFELLVNRQTGAVAPEPGPNMMWNARYGSMGRGMMGAFRPSGAMTVTSAKATQVAQSWLDQNYAGASAGSPDEFYGYYTFHFEKNGQVAGMLSVNGQTGAVWFHTWHGAFIADREVG